MDGPDDPALSLSDARQHLEHIAKQAERLVALGTEFDHDPSVLQESVERLIDALDGYLGAMCGESHLCGDLLSCVQEKGHRGVHRAVMDDGRVLTWEA